MHFVVFSIYYVLYILHYLTNIEIEYRLNNLCSPKCCYIVRDTNGELVVAFAIKFGQTDILRAELRGNTSWPTTVY